MENSIKLDNDTQIPRKRRKVEEENGSGTTSPSLPPNDHALPNNDATPSTFSIRISNLLKKEVHIHGNSKAAEEGIYSLNITLHFMFIYHHIHINIDDMQMQKLA